MTRTPLCQRALPNYSRANEIANMVTHIIGGSLGIIIMAFALIISAIHKNPWAMAGSFVYGLSMIALYSVSSIYHGLKPCYGKKVMQVVDHCTIYLLIAGTYTPILLASIRPRYPEIAWLILSAEWGLAAMAAVFTAIDHNRYKKLSMICYIGMGWLIVFALKPTLECVGLAGFLLLLLGGISYTVGAVLYGIGKNKPVYHTVFHLFVVLGSILQALCILIYVI